MRRSFVAICGVLSLAALSTHAGVVNFNGTVPDDGGEAQWQDELGITFYDEGGYRVTADNPVQTFFLDNDINADSLNVDDDYLFNQNQSVEFTITRVDGAPFTFESFAAGGVFGGTGVLRVTGNLDGGGQVFESFDYIPGSQTGNAFVVNALSSDFSAPLSSVVITRVQGNFAGYDDFQLSEIPGPGAVALLGIAGLVGRRRRRA